MELYEYNFLAQPQYQPPSNYGGVPRSQAPQPEEETKNQQTRTAAQPSKASKKFPGQGTKLGGE